MPKIYSMTTKELLRPSEALVLAYILSQRTYAKQTKVNKPVFKLGAELSMDVRTVGSIVTSLESLGYINYISGSFHILDKAFVIKVPTMFFLDLLEKKLTKVEAGTLLVLRSVVDIYSFTLDGKVPEICEDLNLTHATITSLDKKGYIKINKRHNIELLNSHIDWTTNRYFMKLNIK